MAQLQKTVLGGFVSQIRLGILKVKAIDVFKKRALVAFVNTLGWDGIVSFYKIVDVVEKIGLVFMKVAIEIEAVVQFSP
jgi:hypothetical protein